MAMKLLKLNQRAIKAYGIDWLVPEDHNWMAIDSDGGVYSSDDKPYFGVVWWHSEFTDFLGIVDLEGADWKDTLTYIGKDKHNALLADNEMGFNHD